MITELFHVTSSGLSLHHAFVGCLALQGYDSRLSTRSGGGIFLPPKQNPSCFRSLLLPSQQSQSIDLNVIVSSLL